MDTPNLYTHYINTTFTIGNTDVLPIMSDITAKANDGDTYFGGSVMVNNIGEADFLIYISYDSATSNPTYGDAITLKSREGHEFTSSGISYIKITGATALTGYQVSAFSKFNGDMKSVGGNINTTLQAKNTDTSNLEYIKSVNNRLLVSNTDFGIEISRGSLTYGKRFSKSGYNGDINNVFEDIISWGGTYVVPPAGGIQMSVQSSNSADTNTNGTGIRSIAIKYLDTSYVEHTTTIIMNGLTSVLTVPVNIFRINDVHTETVGSNGYAVGNISITNVAKTITYAQIASSTNTTEQAFYTVPYGKVLYIKAWQAGCGGASVGRFARFRLRATYDVIDQVVNENIFYGYEEICMVDSALYIPNTVAYKFPVGTDVKISAISDSANSHAMCTGLFEGWTENA